MEILNELAQVAKRQAQLTARRNELIRAARTEGHSLRAIAQAAGLTHAAIARITKR